MMILFSLGCVFLTYRISKQVFDEKVGLISSFFLCFSATLFFFTSILHSEIPALFFFLLGMTFFLDKRYDFSGLFLGLAFMTRFFTVIAIIPFFFYLRIRKKKDFKGFLTLIGFFLIPVLPYLILNQLLYDNIFYPFIFQAFMTKHTGQVFNQPFPFYFVNLLKENIFILFSIPGIYYLLKKRSETGLFFFSLLIFAFVPYNLVAHKEMRLMIMSLPLLLMVSSYGLVQFSLRFKKKSNIIIAILLLAFMIQAIPQLRFNTNDDPFDIFYNYIDNSNIKGELWISNPAFIAYSDYKAELLYYPKMDLNMLDILEVDIVDAESILVNTCDIACQPSDPICEANVRQFIESMKENFELVSSDNFWDCELYVFEK
jgi:4-amino-4-deoxy-L-arabinose transferase-like glycosyltransferase